jgi:hypothetical protein
MVLLCCVVWCQVEEVNLFRERRTHVSKGCGFITMQTREQAIEVSQRSTTVGRTGLLQGAAAKAAGFGLWQRSQPAGFKQGRLQWFLAVMLAAVRNWW